MQLVELWNAFRRSIDNVVVFLPDSSPRGGCSIASSKEEIYEAFEDESAA